MSEAVFTEPVAGGRHGEQGEVGLGSFVFITAVTWGDQSFPTIGTRFRGPGVSAVARLTATISPTLLNEFVASYTTDHITQTNTHPEVWQRPSSFTMTGLFPDNGGKLPDFCVSTNGAYGGGFCEGPTAFP